MPIRVVTREARYIYKLSLTLEHSMPISSPIAPGLTKYAFNSSISTATQSNVIRYRMRKKGTIKSFGKESYTLSDPRDDSRNFRNFF